MNPSQGFATIDAHGYVLIPTDFQSPNSSMEVVISAYRREVCVARSTWMGCGRPQEANEQQVWLSRFFVFLHIYYTNTCQWSEHCGTIQYMNFKYLKLLLLAVTMLTSYDSHALVKVINDIYYDLDNITLTASVIYPCTDSMVSSITIPEEIIFIGEHYKVTSIGTAAFAQFPGLTSVVIPNSVTSIGDIAFAECEDLTSIVIPNSVTSIGARAFEQCRSLASIVIPNSVTSIGDWVFMGCYGLKKFALPAGLDYEYSYKDIIYPRECFIDDYGCIYDEDMSTLYYVPMDTLDSYSIPNSVTSIGNHAFSWCENLTADVIPNSVTSIGDYAFENCNKLTSIVIPNSVTSIGDYAFYDCAALTDLTFNAIDCTRCGSIYNPAFPPTISSVTFGDDVSRIPFYILSGCNNLTSVIIPKSVTSIDPDAFKGCDQLESIVFNAICCNKVGRDGYGRSAFPKSVKKITIGENVEKIPDDAFCGLNQLNFVDIPKSVTTIGASAFQYCSSISEITIPESIETLGSNAFNNCSSLTKVYYNAKNCVVNINTFPESLENLVIGDSVKFIPGAFSNTRISSIIIPESVDSIGNSAFRSCKLLTDVVIGSGVKKIGSAAFYGCDSLESIEIPDNVLDLGEWGTFGVCRGLKSVTIGKGISVLPFEVFKACLSLDSIYIPKNVIRIENGAFENAGINNIFFEDGVQELVFGSVDGSPYEPIFQGAQLENMYLGRKIKLINGISPFAYTTLRNVEISDQETKIYDLEFFNCTELKSIKLGKNIQSIGYNAFSNCSGLSELYSCAETPPTCAIRALTDIDKTKCTLYVPAASRKKYMAADQWKDFLFVKAYDAVLIESININVESLDGKTGDTFQLVADVLPDNATTKNVDWSSSDPEIVTVDANGLVTFVKTGHATITARAIDFSDVETTINVVVRIKNPELGDSNANGIVNIADAVNTANYAVGNEVEHFNVEAGDVNQDGIITLADASATVTLILDQPVQASPMAKVRAFAFATNEDSDVLVIDDYSANPGETTPIFVALENTHDYVALQADVTVPEGMTLAAVNIGNRAETSHSLALKRIDERSMRIALFDISNSAFADDSEAILELIVKTTATTSDRIEINNIVACDAQSHEYVLTSTGGNNSLITGIAHHGISDIRIEATADGINIYNAEGNEVAIYAADGTMLARFAAASDFESRAVVPGVYVVAAGGKVEKIMVK